MSDTRHPHVFARPHMCLTCEKFSSHVGKRVKLKKVHFWVFTRKKLTLADKSHEIHIWILCVIQISHVLSTCERNVKR